MSGAQGPCPLRRSARVGAFPRRAYISQMPRKMLPLPSFVPHLRGVKVDWALAAALSARCASPLWSLLHPQPGVCDFFVRYSPPYSACRRDQSLARSVHHFRFSEGASVSGMARLCNYVQPPAIYVRVRSRPSVRGVNGRRILSKRELHRDVSTVLLPPSFSCGRPNTPPNSFQPRQHPTGPYWRTVPQPAEWR